MLDQFERSQRSEPVYKLVAIPQESINSILTKRGLLVDDLPEIKGMLAATGSPFTAEEVVEYAFTRHLNRSRPFGYGRFSNGLEFPVYYSAIEEETCIKEVTHHSRKVFSRDLPYQRYYQFVKSHFSGVAMVLCGQERLHTYLISNDESGYPRCWELAREAHAQVDAFFTPSARAIGGICVPVFVQRALANHQLSSFVTLSYSNGVIEAYRSS